MHVDIDNQELPWTLSTVRASSHFGTRATHDAGATGERDVAARASCWIGLNHRIWSKHGRSPMWVRFNADQWGRAVAMRKALQQWAAMDPPRA